MRNNHFIIITGGVLLAVASPGHSAEMHDMKGTNMSTSVAGQVQATGIVKAIDATAGTVTIAHDPIKELKWPVMTMSFKAAKPGLLTR
jgi:Cu(I)/Ag(I) efflux system periplasmic protein CusF